MIADGGIRVGSTIIEEMHEVLHGGMGAIGLLGGKGTKHD